MCEVTLVTGCYFSKQLRVGTIVLVYDKVSFVSAKSWAENPQLKEGALVNGAALDYIDSSEGVNTKAKAGPIKKLRSKIIRAD